MRWGEELRTMDSRPMKVEGVKGNDRVREALVRMTAAQ